MSELGATWTISYCPKAVTAPPNNNRMMSIFFITTSNNILNESVEQDLLDEHHFFCLNQLIISIIDSSGFQPIKVHTAGNIRAIKLNGIISLKLILIDNCLDFFPKNIVDC